MRVKLISNDMWSPALKLTLDRFPIVIGRNGESDVAIDDRWMSDTHCELHEADGRLRIRDLNSEHGTFINGEQVLDGSVAPGDTLSLGIRSFRISYRRRTSSSSSHPSNGDRSASRDAVRKPM